MPIYDQIGTNNSEPSDVPIPQTRYLVGTFLSVYYSKPALLSIMKLLNLEKDRHSIELSLKI